MLEKPTGDVPPMAKSSASLPVIRTKRLRSLRDVIMKGRGRSGQNVFQERQRNFDRLDNYFDLLVSLGVFVKILVASEVGVRQTSPYPCVVVFLHEMAADVLDLLMASVVPTPCVADGLNELGNRAPSLFPGLGTVSLLLLFARLPDEPSAHGYPVLGA